MSRPAFLHLARGVTHQEVDAAGVPHALHAHLPVVPAVEGREHELVQVVAEPKTLKRVAVASLGRDQRLSSRGP